MSDGVQPLAKHPCFHTALVQSFDGLNHRGVEFLNQLALRQILTALDVLGHHQANKVLVAVVVVKGKTHQSFERFLRR